MSGVRFHLRCAWFGLREQLSDWGSGMLGYLLFPVFLIVLTALWEKFNSHLGHYRQPELTAYVGVTEVLFMTFIRSAYFTRASGDFSLSLARPRSWLVMSGSQCFGRVLGNRLILLGVLAPCLVVFGSTVAEAALILARLALFLVPLTLLAALYNLAFANAQVVWAQTPYLTLPFTKIFLVFGGVFGPLDDFPEGARELLLALPPADLFFQPAYFCVKGHFYETTPDAWLPRLALQALALVAFNVWFHAQARRRHQAYGG